MGADAVQAAVAALRAAHDKLAALPIDALTKSELVGVLDRPRNPLVPAADPEPPPAGPPAGRDDCEGDGRQVVEGRAGDPVAHLHH